MYIMDGGRDEEWEIWMEWPTWIGPVMADMDRGGKVRQWVGDIICFLKWGGRDEYSAWKH